jgi:hypothetical protein
MQFRTQTALISKVAPEITDIEKMAGLFLLKLPASEAARRTPVRGMAFRQVYESDESTK